MTTEHKEVSTKSLHIHRRMGYRLSTIDEHWNLVRVGNVDDSSHIVDSAERVVDMSHADKPCARRDESLELREYQVTVFICRDSAQGGTTFLSNTLPRYNVGMMVEL